MHTPICDQLGIEFPIFAFSHCRDVAAAVSRAGGFGVFGALACPPDQLEIELRWIDEHVGGKPYGVDVVMPEMYAGMDAGVLDKATFEGMIPEAHRRYVNQVLEKFNVPNLPEGEKAFEGLLGWIHDSARSQVDVALRHPLVKLLANALGTPPADVIEKVHGHGIQVAALVGAVQHARHHVEAGVDIVVAQGTEAGGHTGDVATMVLVPEVVDAVRPTPVLAAGGIGCGRQIAAALALGAQGAWTGSIWLTTTESDLHPVAVQKVLRATSRDTVRSRALTGKPARQLRTAWTDAWDGPESPGALPMPLQFLLTSEAVSRIHRYAHVESSGAKELVGTPIGQIVGRMNEVRSVKEVMYEMVEECVDTLGRMGEMVSGASS